MTAGEFKTLQHQLQLSDGLIAEGKFHSTNVYVTIDKAIVYSDC